MACPGVSSQGALAKGAMGPFVYEDHAAVNTAFTDKVTFLASFPTTCVFVVSTVVAGSL